MSSDDDVQQPTGAPTLETVAKAAGVSRSTASRAINGESRVSAATVEAVQRAVRELGYAPNRAARSLVTRRTGSVAVVVPETGERVFADPYFATILGGITAGLAGGRVQLVLLTAQQPGDVEQMLTYVRDGHVDGAIVVSHHGTDHLPEALAGIRIPVAFVGRPVDHAAGLPYVDADNVGGGRQAAEYLLTQGHRRLGTIAGPADMPPGIDRLAGWRSAVEAAGRAADAVERGDFTAEGGAAATAALLERHPDLDAIFVASDLMATGTLQALNVRGVRVPDDIAVVGFDDFLFATATMPPLTTVRQPTREAGRLVAQTLLAMLDGEIPAPAQILPTELIRRQSA